jgi:ectoine hydroxylase-related dioxygenase (phytanoyl-CoA dioxygenase family)
MTITGDDDQGYRIYEHVFGLTEMIAVQDAVEETELRRTRAGARHILGVPAIQRLANDPRLLAIASSFLAGSAVPFRATLFDKSAASNWLVVWHQDTALPLRQRIASAEWGPWSEKAGILYAHAPAWALERVVAARVHLDDSRETNGPLRVVPGTHLQGVLGEDEVTRLAQERDAVDCCTRAGGVVAMRPLTVHASSKSTDSTPRRVLHIEYARTLNLGPGIDLALA